MGVILDLLNSETFRKTPAMHVGSARYANICYWLRGAEYISRKGNPDQAPELDGFREWLHMNFDAPGNTDWQGMIEAIFGAEEVATFKLFECLDKFTEELNEIGLDEIVSGHAEYEMSRYGMLSSSRLGIINGKAIFI